MHTKDLAYTQCLNQNTINVHSVVKNMIRKCMLISRGSISYLELIFDGTPPPFKRGKNNKVTGPDKNDNNLIEK